MARVLVVLATRYTLSPLGNRNCWILFRFPGGLDIDRVCHPFLDHCCSVPLYSFLLSVSFVMTRNAFFFFFSFSSLVLLVLCLGGLGLVYVSFWPLGVICALDGPIGNWKGSVGTKILNVIT